MRATRRRTVGLRARSKSSLGSPPGSPVARPQPGDWIAALAVTPPPGTCLQLAPEAMLKHVAGNQRRPLTGRRGSGSYRRWIRSIGSAARTATTPKTARRNPTGTGRSGCLGRRARQTLRTACSWVGLRRADAGTCCQSGSVLGPPTIPARQRRSYSEAWARWGSNPRPTDYESAALTTELQAQPVKLRGWDSNPQPSP
jgi:hypothetical protein